MREINKCRIVLLLTAFFSLICISEVYAASKYTKIDTIKAYNDSASVDLNGDKIEDDITFELSTEEYGAFTLSINGISVKGEGEELEGNFRIIDINPKDKYKEVAVQEFGPSDDYAIAFYSYNGKSIISMGKLYGYGTSINKAGSIFTNARGSILCTWFYEDYYKLSKKHSLQQIPRKSYMMNLEVTVNKPISLKISPSNSKIKVKLKKGEKVTIVSSDNKKWCLVKNAKGVKGWFAVKNNSQIVGTNYYAYEVFDGLPNAD